MKQKNHKHEVTKPTSELAGTSADVIGGTQFLTNSIILTWSPWAWGLFPVAVSYTGKSDGVMYHINCSASDDKLENLKI